nr:hypothetical protein [Tanacetum cinerariifolium]
SVGVATAEETTGTGVAGARLGSAGGGGSGASSSISASSALFSTMLSSMEAVWGGVGSAASGRNSSCQANSWAANVPANNGAAGRNSVAGLRILL